MIFPRESELESILSVPGVTNPPRKLSSIKDTPCIIPAKILTIPPTTYIISFIKGASDPIRFRIEPPNINKLSVKNLNEGVISATAA